MFADLAATTRRGIVVAALRSIVKDAICGGERTEGEMSAQEYTYPYLVAADQSKQYSLLHP